MKKTSLLTLLIPLFISCSSVSKNTNFVRNFEVSGKNYSYTIQGKEYFEARENKKTGNDSLLGEDRKIIYENTKLNKDLLSDIVNDLNLKKESNDSSVMKILEFVNNISYVSDIPGNSYAKTPLETIVESGGDCEDISVLTYALLKEAGFSPVFVLLNVLDENNVVNGNKYHVDVAVDVAISDKYISISDKNYFLVPDLVSKTSVNKLGNLGNGSLLNYSKIRVFGNKSIDSEKFYKIKYVNSNNSVCDK